MSDETAGALLAGEGWGPWKLDIEQLILVVPMYDSWVELSECTSSSQVLDWILHISGKNWADPSAGDTANEALAGLVRAIDDLLKPQHTLCSDGKPTTMTVEQIRARVQAWASER